MGGSGVGAFGTYAYLFSNLTLLAGLLPVLLWTRRRELSRLALVSGVACLPCSLLALAHEAGYWRPVRLGGGPFGAEDLVFSFVAGALVWLAAAWPCDDLQGPRPLAVKRAAVRLLVWGVASDVLLLGLWRVAGMDCMSATALAGVPLGGYLLIRRPRLWRLAATGVVCFVPVYVAIVRAHLYLWPEYVRQWNAEGPWAYLVAGVPAGEIVWAGAFAALWPLAIASAFDVRSSGF
jgi:hypothetical protein